MLKSFFISLALLVLIIPILFTKFSSGRILYPIEIVVGNYIFFIHYLVIIMFILLIINSFIFTIPRGTSTLIVVLSLLILGVLGYRNFTNTRVVKTEISIDKKSSLDSLRVVFISDLHLTITSNKIMFQKAFDKINALDPDIILIGGDIIDYSHKVIRDDYSQIFKSLKSKYGIYSVLGNHEYYGGIDGNEGYIRSLGINVLRDDVFSIEDIHIIGRDDSHNKDRLPLRNITSDISADETLIIVDHNPQSIDESIDAKGDLQLSGHTHRGQFFPYNLVVDRMYRNGYGYKKIEGLNTIVTAGLGSWLIPYRIGSTSEINLIDITFND